MAHNLISNIEKIILSKLVPSQYREYWKIWNKEFRNRYDDVFGTDEKGKPVYRLYIPVGTNKDLDIDDNISIPSYSKNLRKLFSYNILGHENLETDAADVLIYTILKLKEDEIFIEYGRPYQIFLVSLNKDEEIVMNFIRDYKEAYKNNITPYLASFKEFETEHLKKGYLINKKKQNVKIISFIEKLKYFISKIDTDNDIKKILTDCLDKGIEIYNKFSDQYRMMQKEQTYELVISRHPYDVAGMSTDRGWKSCMELPNESNKSGGCYFSFVRKDVEKGTLVCYLIKSTDKNIEHPIGRINIKPYARYRDESVLSEYFFYNNYPLKKEAESLGKQLESILFAFYNLINTTIYKYDEEAAEVLKDMFSIMLKDKYLIEDKLDFIKVEPFDYNIAPENKLTYTFRTNKRTLEIDTEFLDNINKTFRPMITVLKKQKIKTKDKIIKYFEIFVSNIEKIHETMEQYDEKYESDFNSYTNDSKKDDSIALVIEEGKYGTFPEIARKILHEWLNENVNKNITGLYKKDNELYHDGSPDVMDSGQIKDKFDDEE